MLRMGDAFHEGRPDELPVFDLYVPAFQIGRCELTGSQWDEVRQWGLQHGYPDLPAGFSKGPDHPVGSVTWHAAAKWCNALSEREGLTPCYTTNGMVYRYGTFKKAVSNIGLTGYRLPAEAEWEWAARGGAAGRRFPWNDTDAITQDRANYYSTNSLPYDVSATRGYHPSYTNGVPPYTSPVGSFPPNGYGLHDMAGNAWEWCTDWYDSYPANLGGPPSGDYRVTRGGGWGAFASAVRCAYREPLSPSTSNPSVGFRLARTLPR
jgi:formylglycine-generating enzyme required for sulfatase activity